VPHKAPGYVMNVAILDGRRPRLRRTFRHIHHGIWSREVDRLGPNSLKFFESLTRDRLAWFGPWLGAWTAPFGFVRIPLLDSQRSKSTTVAVEQAALATPPGGSLGCCLLRMVVSEEPR